MKNRDLKKQLAAAIAMTIVATVALGSSTYAWFVSNSKVDAGQTALTATASSSLLIAQDVSGDITTAEWQTHIPLEEDSENLIPISTIGGDMTFYKAKDDSFQAEIADNGGAYSATAFEVCTITEGKNADGVIMDEFYIKNSTAGKLYLDENTTFTHNGTSILDRTLRLALVVTNSKGGDEKVFFYQVNSNEGGTSLDTTFVNNNEADGIKKAISSTTEAGNIIAANLDSEGKVPALVDHKLIDSTVTKQNALFEFKSTDLENGADWCKVTAYIWMEGCDEHCNVENTNSLLTGANTITGQLGFVAISNDSNNA